MNNVSMMDAESEKRSASTISFSSSSSNSSSSCHRLDRLVDAEEIQAAETLAQLAMRDSHSADKWCTKQDTTRVTRESPTLLHSDLSLGPGGQAIAGQYPDEKISTTTVETEMFQQDDCSRHMKVEQDADVLPNTSYSLVRSRKSRRNLTEEEKEVRRIRRILANRESARQTIRRRQALCEELTRKAASLVVENENLKREKQLALNEYQSLETTNKHLKAQIAKSINTEVEKTPVEPGSSVAEFGNQQSSPSSSLKDEQDNLSLGKPCSSSSSLNTMANVDYQAALPIKLKTAASGWTEAISINGPGWATPRSSLDGAYIATSSLEKKQGQCICQGRNLVDAVAAAEARKRRKELTKQKSIHNRQSRMHC